MQVTIDSPSGQLAAVLEMPEGVEQAPGVVIIHEIFGLTDSIKETAREFATIGYAALAVDLIGSSNKTLCMFKLFSQMIAKPLDNPTLRSLRAALEYLQDIPGVDPERIGAVGFCMGGGFSIAWAATDPRVKAVAPFYATNPRPLSAVSRVCPLVGSYPDKDFTTGAGRKLDRQLQLAGVDHDIKIYPGTKHSFFNSPRNAVEEDAKKDAWQRMVTFFDERLK